MTDRGTRLYWSRPTGGEAQPITTRTIIGPERPAWMDDRPDLPCKRHPAGWWFAPEETGDGDRTLAATREDADRAADLCRRRCPKQADCAIYGLRHEHWGIWGGIRMDGLHVAVRRQLLAHLELGRRRPA
jgi:hypothetical protein